MFFIVTSVFLQLWYTLTKCDVLRTISLTAGICIIIVVGR